MGSWVASNPLKAPISRPVSYTEKCTELDKSDGPNCRKGPTTGPTKVAILNSPHRTAAAASLPLGLPLLSSPPKPHTSDSEPRQSAAAPVRSFTAERHAVRSSASFLLPFFFSIQMFAHLDSEMPCLPNCRASIWDLGSSGLVVIYLGFLDS